LAGFAMSLNERKEVERGKKMYIIKRILPDGQLFWIIRNGSPKTSMFAFPSLTDDQVWQLIHYIRQFSK